MGVRPYRLKVSELRHLITTRPKTSLLDLPAISCRWTYAFLYTMSEQLRYSSKKMNSFWRRRMTSSGHYYGVSPTDVTVLPLHLLSQLLRAVNVYREKCKFVLHSECNLHTLPHSYTAERNNFFRTFFKHSPQRKNVSNEHVRRHLHLTTRTFFFQKSSADLITLQRDYILPMWSTLNSADNVRWRRPKNGNTYTFNMFGEETRGWT